MLIRSSYLFLLALIAVEAREKHNVQELPIENIHLNSNQKLLNHSSLFEKRIEEVSPGNEPRVFVAIGYSLANMIMIEGKS